MPLPTPDRLAHHEAGHAVVQHWIARGRYRVDHVSLETDGCSVAGSSLLDGETLLGLYEFGLATLAGIAAENRYFSEHPPPEGEEIWGAVGDIEEWLDAARPLLESDARVQLVTHNVMRHLDEFFRDEATWCTVCRVAEVLLAEGNVEGERLHAILEGRAPLS